MDWKNASAGTRILKPLPTVACKWCGESTVMTGTRQCDRCWELSNRIEANPELAQRMLRDPEPAARLPTIDVPFNEHELERLALGGIMDSSFRTRFATALACLRARTLAELQGQ